MRCPECDGTRNRVVDTRTSRGGRAVRRRRECEECDRRFTTYEYVEERPIMVLKRGGDAEEYDRSKLMRSLTAACAKRPLSADEIDGLVEDIEDELTRSAGVEISSVRISEMVMNQLKARDRVAYVRYASVYRNFRDLDEFQEFVADVRARQRREQLSRDQVELPFLNSAAGTNGEESQPEG